MYNMSRGFSFVEIVVVVTIVTLLGAVAILSLSAMRDRLVLNDARSALSFHLEESKAKAVAGTGGVAHGIYFATSSYTQFAGSSYDEEETTNIVHQLDPKVELTTDILNGENSVVFSRITGAAEENVTITISLGEAKRTIVVGAGGDISYEE